LGNPVHRSFFFSHFGSGPLGFVSCCPNSSPFGIMGTPSFLVTIARSVCGAVKHFKGRGGAACIISSPEVCRNAERVWAAVSGWAPEAPASGCKGWWRNAAGERGSGGETAWRRRKYMWEMWDSSHPSTPSVFYRSHQISVCERMGSKGGNPSTVHGTTASTAVRGAGSEPKRFQVAER
jgi:hypothetical protein